MSVGQMPVGSNSLGTRTLDRYMRVGLHECVLSTMSWSPPETTQDRTQTKDIQPIPGEKLKFLTPPGIEPGLRVGRQGLYRPRHGDGLIFLLSLYIDIGL